MLKYHVIPHSWSARNIVAMEFSPLEIEPFSAKDSSVPAWIGKDRIECISMHTFPCRTWRTEENRFCNLLDSSPARAPLHRPQHKTLNQFSSVSALSKERLKRTSSLRLSNRLEACPQRASYSHVVPLPAIGVPRVGALYHSLTFLLNELVSVCVTASG